MKAEYSFEQLFLLVKIPIWVLLVTLPVSAYVDAAEYKTGDRLTQNTPKDMATPDKAEQSSYRVIEWEALIPKGWDLVSEFNSLNLDDLEDDDPRAMQVLEDMKKKWARAPVEASLNGQRIGIAGFMIPLEQNEGKISEFLLVPYFGACIHVPPPPANQIIYVMTKSPVEVTDAMVDVWVYGILYTEQSDNEMGHSGYRLLADRVTPYTTL